MEGTYDRDRSSFDTKDDAILYVDCIRLVEGDHVRRLENILAKFDIIQYELNDGPSKSLLVYVVEHNDEILIKILLEMKILLEKKYTISGPYKRNVFHLSID